MANFIRCTKVGCGRVVRESHQISPGCLDCNDRLCEWCCDDKKDELAAAAKEKANPTKLIGVTLYLKVSVNTDAAQIHQEIEKISKTLESKTIQLIATLVDPNPKSRDTK